MAKVKAAPAEDDLDDLNQLVGNAKVHEDAARALIGGQNSYIKIISDPKAPELKSGKPEYIEGATYESFVIASKKLALGEELTATVLGIFKLYEESVPAPEGSGDMAKIVSYWMPEDAEQIPVDGQFDRPFVAKDGTQHVLHPVHWVFVYIKGFEEIDNALFAFRSKGNAISAKLAKTIKNGSEIAPQIKFKVTTQEIEAKAFNKSYLYPDFIEAGKNFDFDEAGKIQLVKGGFNAKELKVVLGRYAAMQAEYAENKLVGKKTDIARLIGAPAGKPAIAATTKGRGGYVKPAADEESPSF